MKQKLESATKEGLKAELERKQHERELKEAQD